MEVNELLKSAMAQNASDLHIKVGSPPIMRVNGELAPMASANKVSQEDALKIAFSVMSPAQREIFKKKNDLDLAYSIPGLGRFRCNAFVQRGAVGIVFRVIPMRIPTIEELQLPDVLKKIALEPRGLILVTGTTGSGKSTTLAAMIDYINTNRTNNIVTIEDPIEYLHRDKSSIINQREVGNDTESFSKALRAALRQDPDVILVGEMRDFETIQISLTAAETGHLVLSTLHTIDAMETVNRIISVFPPYQHKQVRMQLVGAHFVQHPVYMPASYIRSRGEGWFCHAGLHSKCRRHHEKIHERKEHQNSNNSQRNVAVLFPASFSPFLNDGFFRDLAVYFSSFAQTHPSHFNQTPFFFNFIDNV